MQFYCLTADFNFYICVESDGNFYLFPTVVDDNLDVCTCLKLCEEIYSKLIERFKWKPSGKCFWFFGCGMKQNYKEISFNQCAFLNNLLESFNCHKIKKSDTPAVSKVLPMPKPDEPFTDFSYASFVGSLIWLMKTHPDISYAVSQCFCFLNTHTEDHNKAALQILSYLAKYPDYELVFLKSKSETKELVISAQVNSSHQDVTEDRSSSYSFAIFVNSSSISWHSKKSPQVCWSSCESEYHALAEASYELKFIDNILFELCILYKRPFLLQFNSVPVIAIAKIPHVNQRTKQIEAFDYYTRKALWDSLIELNYVPTKDNLTDIFTKPLGPNVFTPHQNNLICPCCSVN